LSDNDQKYDTADVSISSQAIALGVTVNDSLATVLEESGMEMRDFIVLSFVSDEGPIATDRLARLIGIDRDTTSRCIERLINEELLVSDVFADAYAGDVVATNKGNLVAKKILSQL